MYTKNSERREKKKRKMNGYFKSKVGSEQNKEREEETTTRRHVTLTDLCSHFGCFGSKIIRSDCVSSSFISVSTSLSLWSSFFLRRNNKAYRRSSGKHSPYPWFNVTDVNSSALNPFTAWRYKPVIIAVGVAISPLLCILVLRLPFLLGCCGIIDILFEIIGNNINDKVIMNILCLQYGHPAQRKRQEKTRASLQWNKGESSVSEQRDVSKGKSSVALLLYFMLWCCDVVIQFFSSSIFPPGFPP